MSCPSDLPDSFDGYKITQIAMYNGSDDREEVAYALDLVNKRGCHSFHG
jgi:hypothetical protein